jgi:hypothetical protein
MKRFNVFNTIRLSGLGLENGTILVATDLGAQLRSAANRYEQHHIWIHLEGG